MRTWRQFHQMIEPLCLLFRFSLLLVLLLAVPDASWGTITFTQRPNGTPNPVNSGGTVSLSVTAVESLGHPVSYNWQPSCASILGSNGTLSDPTSQTPTWTAPINTTGSAQACTMNVRVSDGQGDSDFDLYAQWVNAAGTMSLSVAIGGSGTGTVATSQPPPQGLNCGSGTPNTGTCVANFTSGTSVTLMAAPIGSSTFDGWGGDCGFAGTALTCSLTMNAPKSVTATFTQTAAFNLSLVWSGTVV